MVQSVQVRENASRNRESLADFRQQASIGFNVLVTLVSAIACGYYIGVHFFPGNSTVPWVLAALFGIVMLVVDAIIAITRLSLNDHTEAKRARARRLGPLGVTSAVAGSTPPQPQPQPRAAETAATPAAAEPSPRTTGLRKRR